MSLAVAAAALKQVVQIQGEGIATALLGTAQVISEAATEIRGTKGAAQALSRRVNELVTVITTELEALETAQYKQPDGWRKSLLNFQEVLMEAVAALKKCAQHSYIMQVLHQDRDARELKSVSEHIEYAFEALMIEARLNIVHMSASALPSKALAEVQSFKISRPVLEALDSTSSRPPAPPYYFGRMNEVMFVVDIITGPSPGHVVILGAPGMGKTSLAVVVMHQPQVLTHFNDRRYFVSCETTVGQSSCLASVSGFFGVSYSNPKVAKKSLARILGEAPTLLVLDNFESCWEAPDVRSLAEEELQFLGTIPTLTLIVTLRGSERPYGIPWAKPFLPPLAPLDDAASIETFLTVSGMEDSSPGVRALTKQLGNIPLAVVLMANLAQYESTDVLLTRWESHRTAMLQRGSDLNRLHSLDASISLSIQSPRMRADAKALELLGQLSLLPRGVVDTDLRLWNGYQPHALSTLFQTSLVHRSPDNRVYVLPPIREFVLHHYPPSDAVAEPLYDHYFGLADLLRKARPDVGKESHLMSTAAREVENIESVIRYALGRGEQRAVLATVHTCALHILAGFGTGPDLLQSALRTARAAGLDALVADLLLSWGIMTADMGVPGDAAALYREARDLYERVGNHAGAIDAGCNLTVYLEPAEAISEATRLRAVAEELCDLKAVAVCSRRLGQACERAGRMADARAGYAQAVEKLRAAGKADTRSFAMSLMRVATFDSYAGDLDRAIAQYHEALPLLEATNYITGVGVAHTALGKAYFVQGQFADAVNHFQRSLAAYRAAKYKFEVLCLSRLAFAHLGAGDDGAAEDAIESAEKLTAGEGGSDYSRGFVLRARGALARHHGDLAAARAILHAACMLDQRMNQRESEAHLLHAETLALLGGVELAAGHCDDARTLFVTAALLWRKHDRPVDLVIGLCNLAEALDDETARAVLEAMLLPLQRFGCRGRRAGAMLQLAGITQRRGDFAEALRRAGVAVKLFVDAGDEVGAEKARAVVEHLRVES